MTREDVIAYIHSELRYMIIIWIKIVNYIFFSPYEPRRRTKYKEGGGEFELVTYYLQHLNLNQQIKTFLMVSYVIWSQWTPDRLRLFLLSTDIFNVNNGYKKIPIYFTTAEYIKLSMHLSLRSSICTLVAHEFMISVCHELPCVGPYAYGSVLYIFQAN